MSESRLQSLSSDPVLRNFARDASQSAIKRIANFLAPRVEVPDVTGKYKQYDSKHRYKRPKTRRETGDRATRIGFTAKDKSFNLESHALDFPVPISKGMSKETAMHHAQYGSTLLADAGALDHEAETIELAIDTVGAGTDVDFAAANLDPIKRINAEIKEVIKSAKNGAPIKVLFGADVFLEIIDNPNTLSRFVGGNGTAKKGAALQAPDLSDIQKMLFSNPKCELSLYVEDQAEEGLEEDIEFLLSNQVLIFASNDSPNTMDPSFMKTFVPMGGFMVPGVYRTEDDRDEVLKMDWTMQIIATNTAAASRLNHVAA